MAKVNGLWQDKRDELEEAAKQKAMDYICSSGEHGVHKDFACDWVEYHWYDFLEEVCDKHDIRNYFGDEL